MQNRQGWDPVRKHVVRKLKNLNRPEFDQFIMTTAKCFLVLLVKKATFIY